MKTDVYAKTKWLDTFSSYFIVILASVTRMKKVRMKKTI